MRYAQILNGKAHWIFTDDMTIDELYAKKFNPAQIQIVKINDEVQEGWTYTDGVFVNPESLITDAEKLANLKSSKLSDIKAKLATTDYKCLKYVDGELTEAEYADVKAERHNLRVAYNAIEAATTIEEVNLINY